MRRQSDPTGALPGGGEAALRRLLADELSRSRAATLRLLEGIDDALSRATFDPALSPLGWHLGHVAWQEEWWVLRRSAGQPPIDPALDGLYDAFRSGKRTRGARLPPLAAIRAYAERVRERSLAFLERARFEGPLLGGGWAFRFVADHERQHAETMAMALLAGSVSLSLPEGPAPQADGDEDGWCTFLEVEEGPFPLGTDDDPARWDNEGPAHAVELAPFSIARAPVTNGAFLRFLEEGGYDDERLWSPEGWRWRRAAAIEAPGHWRRGRDGWERRTLRGFRPVEPSHPVSHLSAWEAEAFAAWAGARLPTEAEWERAASWEAATGTKRRWPGGDEPPRDANLAFVRWDTCPVGPREPSPVGALEMAGNVWEWTASPFLPWPGFTPGPYAGYSAPWFGPAHRVLRGGCWATDSAMARTTFRNWFEPGMRLFPSGLRLARDGRGGRGGSSRAPTLQR